MQFLCPNILIYIYLIYVKYNIHISLEYLIPGHSHGHPWHFYTLKFGLNPCDKYCLKIKDVKIQAGALMERRLHSFMPNLLDKLRVEPEEFI